MVRMQDGKIMKRQCHLSLKVPLYMSDKFNHFANVRKSECEKDANFVNH